MVKINIDKEIPWTFDTWILKFKDVDLPIGDLARYISEDPDFPLGDYLSDNIDYLQDKNAPTELIVNLCEVWNFCVASTGITGDQQRVRNALYEHKDSE